VLGEEHPDGIVALYQVSYGLIEQAKYREAEASCRQTLALGRKVLGDEHPLTGKLYGDLAMALGVQEKNKESEEYARK
jgi:hypothetical protein